MVLTADFLLSAVYLVEEILSILLLFVLTCTEKRLKFYNHSVVRTYFKREFRWLGGKNIFAVLLLSNWKELIIFQKYNKWNEIKATARLYL